MDKQEMAKMYMEYLDGEGYRPEIDSDGDVRYKHEGRTYFIIVDEKDQEFFRICFPSFWSVDDEIERRQVLVACDHATGTTKVAKVYTVGDKVWGSYELFIQKPEDFKPVFARGMRAIRAAVASFVSKMRE